MIERLAAALVLFEPASPAAIAPARLPSPFASGAPHPLAARAAAELMSSLDAGWPLPQSAFLSPQRGKMFGVLVVATPEGRLGYLKAFSGMLDGHWQRPGFAPPVFDEDARDRFWPAGEAALRADDAALAEIEARLHEAEARHAALVDEQREARKTLDEMHRARKARRDRERAAPGAARDLEATLVRESRFDAAEKRRLRAAQRLPAETSWASVQELRGELGRVRERRHARSSSLLEQLFAGYQLPNARGERRSLRAIFAPATPPGGAGDCAAPKLLVDAHRRGLTPLALAEFWWGAPPLTGGRRHGTFYPACRGKCGPVLAHLLEGRAVEPAPLYGQTPGASDAPAILFEDDWIMVVEKPPGLLSVPGRAAALSDAVETRLSARRPEAAALTVVHRLDLETSGLLLVAKDLETRRRLQAQFALRQVEKRYVAWVEGTLAAAEGLITLALRGDRDDRPRQIHDPLHGKAALTRWTVSARGEGRTRVFFEPTTGRTHQLRVHAAHPQGLDAPIVGDRLYGREGERMLLHAESLRFSHPASGVVLTFASPAPF